MNKNILLFGPIGDFGGRELESGFVASILSTKYNVAICSSGTISKKSQAFAFDKNLKVFSVKQLLFDEYWVLKLLAYISFFKNFFKGEINSYVNSAIAKRFLSYDKKTRIILENLITDYDAIFVVAQLSSGLVSDAIKIAKRKNKKVLFRTTGTITFSDFDFINSVDYFIHHSINNSSRLEENKNHNHNYTIIDQCAYNEIDLFEIPTSDKKIFKFLILSRLSPEKGVQEIIDFFLRVCSENDILFIAGNGVLERDLKIKFKDLKNIKFLGFVKSSDLSALFEIIDCLIIPSPEESGPLVGIEAMCAGKIIISTKVGAMQERMIGSLNDYWFDNNNFESFRKVFFDVKKLNVMQIKKTSVSLKEKYKMEYSIHEISKKYLNIVDKVLYPCE
ncbi:glycosyltransferase family 1 protein [Flavobacterium petrolei]|uniref:Glycosyltransferase family 1 protein n=1 Tax=Flavobacterium petrolei TaxID=2259594 RepID=A0A482TWG4_9FLAO|nr:glycosyltransferase [Flavobacterium petrolei]RYJ50880.1 glycosyltransferase family 1 protein [Flavobacterium petrolei]